MITNWKELLAQVMKEFDESFDDVESNTMTESDMAEGFDDGPGSAEGCPFTVWTKNSVYFPVCHDGSEWVGRVSRNPNLYPTKHQGGY